MDQSFNLVVSLGQFSEKGRFLYPALSVRYVHSMEKQIKTGGCIRNALTLLACLFEAVLTLNPWCPAPLHQQGTRSMKGCAKQISC